jgi:hypothetical protein
VLCGQAEWLAYLKSILADVVELIQPGAMITVDVAA